MRLLDRLVAAVESAEVLDKPSKKVAGVVDTALRGERIRDTLSGTWLGHPLHPLMVTVPIGSFVAASALDFIDPDNVEGSSRQLIGLGILAAAPTAAAGLNDWRYTAGPERRVGAVHALANTVALALYGASWVARGRGATFTGKVLALAGATVMGGGGYLGGHLTYANGVGVDATAFSTVPSEWTLVAKRDDIQGGDFVEAKVNGLSVLLAEVGGEVVAMANRCTHRGAPLHEGRREADCVRCPWHDSSFSLEDGSVAVGPAARPQPVYEVRTVAGNIEIRNPEATFLRGQSVGASSK